MTKILVVTHFPSPYQVELFNTVSGLRCDSLAVAYLHHADPDRSWAKPVIDHRALYLADSPDVAVVDELIDSTALVVFNYYQDRRAARLIRRRAASGRPWAFWGERPGFRHAGLGRIARHVTLRPLHVSRAPIWGIGGWAVTAYRDEFGSDREYVNLPYFSDLTPYAGVDSGPPDPAFVFVYSGSLSHRKGVDLLARAFLRLAPEFPNARLRFVGSGALADELKNTLAPVSDRIEMRGFVDWRAMPGAYAGGHVLCVPSRHDGWALVVPEGLAAGLPVIATDHTGAALDLITPRNGWLIAAGDGDALLQSMRAAASSTREQWAAMRDAARASVSGHSVGGGAERFLAAADRAIAANTPVPVR